MTRITIPQVVLDQPDSGRGSVFPKGWFTGIIARFDDGRDSIRAVPWDETDIRLNVKLAENEAKVTDLEARAQANLGRALERSSRVQENRALAVERIAESQKDRDLGTLHMVRAMKELQQMDFDEVEKMIKLSRYIQDQTSPEEVMDQARVETPNIEEIAVMAQGEKNV